jgi:hypothetical protein
MPSIHPPKKRHETQLTVWRICFPVRGFVPKGVSRECKPHHGERAFPRPISGLASPSRIPRHRPLD